MDYYQVFFGAVLVLTLQSIPVGIVNLRQPRTANRLLGCFVLLFIFSSVRNTLIHPLADQEFFRFIGGTYFGSYYDPLLYLYLLALLKEQSLKTIGKHMVVPTVVLVMSLIAYRAPQLLGNSWFTGFFNFLILGTTLFYAFLGLRLLLRSGYWSNILARVRSRVKGFYIFVLIYFLYATFRQVIIVSGDTWVDLLYYIDSIYYLIIFAIIPVYGYTEVTNLKKLFVPSKMSIASNVDVKHTISELNKLMDQELFRDPSLKLDTLAAMLDLKKQDLSLILQNSFNTTFQDYINERRIECFKREARRPENRKLDISGLAMNCGFSSRASFYRIYKRSESGSPQDLVKQAP
ncbi:MAG: helix-turn-helix transcriptional regulator [Roseivirga sp.]|nr:helix-turn-helix transcriptional regulator [Roseivirga sp.]